MWKQGKPEMMNPIISERNRFSQMPGSRKRRSYHRSVLSFFLTLLYLQKINGLSTRTYPQIKDTTLTRRNTLCHSCVPIMRSKQRVALAMTKERTQQTLQEEIINDGKNEDTVQTTLPSFRRLLIFTTTTIIIWLSEPLLSLVDTTVVSLTSHPKSAIVQIAALGPATTLYDSLIYVTYFLAIATTNQLAPLLALKKWEKLRRRTSHLMGLSVLLGSLITLVIFGFGKQLLGMMVGPNQAIVPLATKYVWIRALVAPCVILECVAQCFCLTTLDTKTPAIAVLVASVVNIIGDLALSPRWGIQGAAIATALASISSSSILVNKVRKTTMKWKQNQENNQVPKIRASDGAIEMLTTASNEISESTSNVAKNENDLQIRKQSEEIPFFSLPDKRSLTSLIRLAGPIFFVMMGKVACYSSMTLRATQFGLVSLATHNIMMRVFFFFACFGDSLGQAAQSFFPQVAKIERGKLLKMLFGSSALVGVTTFQASKLILTRMGSFLTKDAIIARQMAVFSDYVGLSVLIHPFIMLLEGVVLAKRDLRFLVGLYLTTLLIHFLFCFSPLSATFRGLWRSLLFFQSIRFIQFAVRTWQKSSEAFSKPQQQIAQ